MELGVLLGFFLAMYFLPVLDYFLFELELLKGLRQTKVQIKIKDLAQGSQEKASTIGFTAHSDEDESEIYEDKM